MVKYDATPERWSAWDSGARQRASAYWRGLVERDPTLERAYITVEVIAGGRTYLLARSLLQTTRGSTGEVMQYLPALMSEPSLTQEIVIGSQAAGARSVNVQVPGWVFDANTALASGYMLAGVAEVALQVDGGDYDLRFVLMRGSVTGGVAFGESTELVALTITDPRDLQERKIPPWVVDSTAWPTAQESAVGERIPRVYNGAIALPALRVLDDHGSTGLYFALCDTPEAFDIGTLYVNGEAVAAGDPTYGWTESTVSDGYGRRVLVSDHSGSGGGWADRDAVNVTLTRASGVASLGVLDIVKTLLAENTGLGLLGLNLDLFSYAEARISPTAPNVVINASGQDTPGVLEYVEGGLLGSYPMVHMAYSGAGLGAVVIDRRTGPDGRGSVGELVGGSFPLYDRETMYQERPKGELFTDFELRYAYDPMTRAFGKVITRDPETSPGCDLAARAIGGRRPFDVIESTTIGSDEDARYVIDWLAAHHTVPFYTVEWSCSPWVHFRYRVGDNVIFTDPEFSAFTRVVATIVRLDFQRGAHTVGLAVWHPALTMTMASGG